MANTEKSEYLRRLTQYSFRGVSIPEPTCYTIADYVCSRIRPGGFIEAVVCNDLRKSFMLADDRNVQAMYAIVAWFYNHAPAECWGSRERFEGWINARTKQAT